MEKETAKNLILKEFDKAGLILRPQAFLLLDQQLSYNSENDFKAKLTNLIKMIKGINSDATIISDEICNEAFKIMESKSLSLQFKNEISSIITNHLIVMNRIPKKKYNLFPNDALKKSAMYEKRFQAIKQKLNKSHNLNEIGSIVGTIGQKKIFGILYEQEKGVFYLEDPLSRVKLDFSKTEPCLGFINSGFLATLEGTYENNVFNVGRVLRTEMIDEGKLSNDYVEKIKEELPILLDLKHKKNLEQMINLGYAELENHRESCVLVINNFRFGPENFAKLETTLRGLENQKVGVFLLIGEFFSSEIKEKKEEEGTVYKKLINSVLKNRNVFKY